MVKTWEDFEKELKKEFPDMVNTNELIVELVARRKELKWSQRKLSEVSGVQQAQIARIETREIHNPGLNTIVKLARCLGMKLTLVKEENIK